MSKQRRINSLDSFEVLMLSVLIATCIAMALVGIAAEVAEASTPTRYDGHRHIMFQCDRADEGRRELCEQFIIRAHPTPNEHHEATATHRYEVELCDLSRSGGANNCEVWFVPKGDQIIAPEQG